MGAVPFFYPFGMTIFLVLLAAMWQIARATDTATAWLNKEFEMAQKAETGGHYREAVKCYEQILHHNPSIPQVYNNLGLDYYRLKDYEKAAVTLRQGLNLKPTMFGSRLFLGFAESHLGNFKESQKVLSSVVRIQPENRRARLFLIRDQTGLGRFDMDFAQRTLRLFPESIEINYAIGTGALQRMMQIANYANQLGVESPIFQWISLRIDTEKGDLDSARKWRERLQKEGVPTPPSLIREYDGLALMVQHCFQRVLERSPNSTFGYDVQGRIDEAQGQVTQALAEYRKAADDFSAGRLLAENFRLPEAVRELEVAVATQPENKLAAALLAKVYVQEHQPAHALPVLQRLLKEFPDDAYAWRDLGRAQFDLGQIGQAVHSFQTAVQLNPSLNKVHYGLAMAYRKLGQTQLEKEELEKFRSAAPTKQIHAKPVGTN